ncbi:MAG: hypothetical protein H6636_04110 [Anaerolineales bacterium]|nr:hypothetical protein [Anaerolineales bacterium]
MSSSKEYWCYCYAGLRIDSQLQIPEWKKFEQENQFPQADVNIRLVHLVEEVREELPFVRADEYRFCIPEVATYWVAHGNEIKIFPAQQAENREIRLYLLGSAWGALCYQRDLLVLHASAVQVGEEAVAFCAAPGHGKSTLAAWLTEAGYPFVSDDLVRCDLPVHGQPILYPTAPRLKLWQDTLDALAWDHTMLERDHFRHEKFHMQIPGNYLQRPVPLRALYLLEWGDFSLTRLTGQIALRRLIAAATYRGALIEPMGKMGSYWQQFLELVRRVPVWELRRPRDVTEIVPTITQLQMHWAAK